MQLLHGGPEMIEGLAAWEAYHNARLAKLAEEARTAAAARQAIIDAEKAKKAAAQSKRDAKLQAAKSDAEALLARIPAKGTTVTVDGFTGKVFWVGVSKYRGKWNARAGVKDTKGNVQWIDAMKF
jgi:nucleoid-associated protein YgaU